MLTYEYGYSGLEMQECFRGREPLEQLILFEFHTSSRAFISVVQRCRPFYCVMEQSSSIEHQKPIEGVGRCCFYGITASWSATILSPPLPLR